MIFENAHEILKKIKVKEISAKEVLESFLKQVEEINPSINAVVALDAERALEKAKEADKEIASKSKLGSLHGLPMTIKDAFEVEGIIFDRRQPSLARKYSKKKRRGSSKVG